MRCGSAGCEARGEPVAGFVMCGPHRAEVVTALWRQGEPVFDSDDWAVSDLWAEEEQP